MYGLCTVAGYYPLRIMEDKTEENMEDKMQAGLRRACMTIIPLKQFRLQLM